MEVSGYRRFPWFPGIFPRHRPPLRDHGSSPPFPFVLLYPSDSDAVFPGATPPFAPPFAGTRTFVVVMFPAQKASFTGCIFGTQLHPGANSATGLFLLSLMLPLAGFVGKVPLSLAHPRSFSRINFGLFPWVGDSPSRRGFFFPPVQRFFPFFFLWDTSGLSGRSPPNLYFFSSPVGFFGR